MRDRRFREAEEIYRSLLKQNPDDISVKQLLSHALINEKKFLEADSLLRRLVEADSNNAGNYWYQGISAMNQKQDSLAIVLYKTHIRKSEDKPNQKTKAWLFIGSAYRRLMQDSGINRTQFDDMLYHYKRYLVLNPYDPFATEIQKFIETVTPKRPEENGVLRWNEKN
jgi:tetratricopeptide (TPR) repeat protein